MATCERLLGQQSPQVLSWDQFLSHKYPEDGIQMLVSEKSREVNVSEEVQLHLHQVESQAGRVLRYDP